VEDTRARPAGRRWMGMRAAAPALALFFMAPWVAEFLLGNLSIAMLPALVVLAPMYGGGALLVRELVRRNGRGWPSIFVLGLAYGIVEEAFTTQSLFNPDYLKANLHLLDPAYIPALGIGAWWTLFVLTLHTVWSIATSIGLVEAFVPTRHTRPWLGRMGLAVTAVLFAIGCAISAFIALWTDSFVASPAQFLTSAVIVVLLIAIAFRLPRAADTAGAGGLNRHLDADTAVGTAAPNAWIVGACSFAAASAFLLVPPRWEWTAVAAYVALYGVAIAAGLHWSRATGWGSRHRLAAAAGAALAYAWHAFPQPAFGGDPRIDLIGNAIFAAMAVALIAAAARRVLRAEHAPGGASRA